MTDPTALSNMRHWIIDKIEDNKKKLHTWQINATFVGIFISAVVGFGLFFISKPLAISALIPFGLSLIVPLFITAVPFSEDNLIVLVATQRYEHAISETLSAMNVGIDTVRFPESVLGEDVKVLVTADEKTAEISMREVNEKIKFYHNDKAIMPNPDSAGK